MTQKKTVGILCAVLLVAMLVTIPLFDHAYAKTKTNKETSNTKLEPKPKESIDKRNSKTESRHKNLNKEK